jgi:transposase
LSAPKANKIYNCFKCKTIIDRDINGARNIAVKRLSEYKSYKKNNKEKGKKNINTDFIG